MPDTKIIKKYANRTMYDTSQSKYISLADLKQYVMEEISFEVREAKSKKDITRQVLLQIIADEENAGTPLFTPEVLTRFIRMYGNSGKPNYSGFLDQISKFLEHETTQFFEQLPGLSGKYDLNPMKAWADLARQNVENWQEARKKVLEATGIVRPKSRDKRQDSAKKDQ